MLNAPIQCGEILNYAGGKINYQFQGKHQDFVGFFLLQIWTKFPNFKILMESKIPIQDH